MIVVIRVQILFSISSHIIPFIKLNIILLYPIAQALSSLLLGACSFYFLFFTNLESFYTGQADLFPQVEVHTQAVIDPFISNLLRCCRLDPRSNPSMCKYLHKIRTMHSTNQIGSGLKFGQVQPSKYAITS